MINNHLGNGRLFSEFLVVVQPWVCPEVQAPATEHPCMWHICPVLSPMSGSSGQWGGTQQEARGPPSSDPWNLQTLEYSQCVLPFLCEADTSRSRWERQQQTPALTSCPGQRRPSALWMPPQVPVSPVGGEPAPGQCRAQSTSWLQGFLLRIASTTGHCQKERKTDRQTDRQEGRGKL